MSSVKQQAGIRVEWQNLLGPLAAKPPGLETLEPYRAKLETTLSRVEEVTKQQAALAAQKQELTKELQALLTSGQRVAALLRKGLKEALGPEAEQLTAFKLQPFRGRKVKKNDTAKKPKPAAQDQKERAAEPAI